MWEKMNELHGIVINTITQSACHKLEYEAKLTEINKLIKGIKLQPNLENADSNFLYPQLKKQLDEYR